jgi:hypothetical protein
LRTIIPEAEHIESEDDELAIAPVWKSEKIDPNRQSASMSKIVRGHERREMKLLKEPETPKPTQELTFDDLQEMIRVLKTEHEVKVKNLMAEHEGSKEMLMRQLNRLREIYEVSVKKLLARIRKINKKHQEWARQVVGELQLKAIQVQEEHKRVMALSMNLKRMEEMQQLEIEALRDTCRDLGDQLMNQAATFEQEMQSLRAKLGE